MIPTTPLYYATVVLSGCQCVPLMAVCATRLPTQFSDTPRGSRFTYDGYDGTVVDNPCIYSCTEGGLGGC